jgi:hypothetical protein
MSASTIEPLDDMLENIKQKLFIAVEHGRSHNEL